MHTHFCRFIAPSFPQHRASISSVEYNTRSTSIIKNQECPVLECQARACRDSRYCAIVERNNFVFALYFALIDFESRGFLSPRARAAAIPYAVPKAADTVPLADLCAARWHYAPAAMIDCTFLPRTCAASRPHKIPINLPHLCMPCPSTTRVYAQRVAGAVRSPRTFGSALAGSMHLHTNCCRCVRPLQLAQDGHPRSAIMNGIAILSWPAHMGRVPS